MGMEILFTKSVASHNKMKAQILLLQKLSRNLRQIRRNELLEK
jgi:hypothetical protein